MSRREILLWPDPMLRRVCAPVAPDGLAVAADLGGDLFETMYGAPGQGLAAPQVGIDARVCVIDTGWSDGAPDPVLLINPEIVAVGGDEEISEETCLSIPGAFMPVARPARVHLRWLDGDGAVEEGIFEGRAARIVLHELDHLDGIVITDKIVQDAAPADSRPRPPRPGAVR